MPRPDASPVVFCELRSDTKSRIEQYAEDIARAAFGLGSHGLTRSEFDNANLFGAAIERLRGQQAASMATKRRFVDSVLTRMLDRGDIAEYGFVGGGERHDYEVRLAGNRLAAIEAKGCLDGNNTNIFERPPSADEFAIWSLCQNPGADPRHNVWSGVHTRLTAEIMHRHQLVDGLIVWDMVCGTAGRPCPKTDSAPERATTLGATSVPPPCIYLFPRTLPDPRNNPCPECWRLDERPFLSALARAFGCRDDDVVEVSVEARMNQNDVERRTALRRAGTTVRTSGWTALKRARV
jgi:hypothetical protein